MDTDLCLPKILFIAIASATIIHYTVSLIPSALPSCPTGCQCIQEVHHLPQKLRLFDCNGTINLTNATFSVNTANNILIENVVINSIHKDAFRAFAELDAIHFLNADIHHIDKDSFNLPELTSVTMHNTILHERLNLVSDSVEELVVYNCQLSELPVLDHLGSLITLNLTKNNIRILDLESFHKLENLEELNLMNNSLNKLHIDQFANNTDLNTLQLDHNPLEVFQLSTTTNLEYVSLSNCQLKLWTRSTCRNMPIVSILILNHNQIAILASDTFIDMSELNKLDLSHNHIQYIPPDIFYHNTRLDQVQLSHNPLHQLPSFDFQRNSMQMYALSCINCSLTSLAPDTFKHTHMLSKLHLGSNSLLSEHISALRKLSNLFELDLSNNMLSLIDADTFSSLTHLLTLNLAGNPLKQLDPAHLHALGWLENLDISNCGLSTLWTTTINRTHPQHNVRLAHIKRLLASRNSFKNLDVAHLAITPRLKDLDISYNHFICQQSFVEAISYLISHAVFPLWYIEGEESNVNRLLRETTHFEEIQDGASMWNHYLKGECGEEMHKSLIGSPTTSTTPTTTNHISNNHKSNTEPTEHKVTNFYEDYEYEENGLDADVDDVSNTDNASLDMQSNDIGVTVRASYMLSLTTIFTVTALTVLIVSVSVTVAVMKRNGTFQLRYECLPRIKLPICKPMKFSDSEHDISVYQPLTEDKQYLILTEDVGMERIEFANNAKNATTNT